MKSDFCKTDWNHLREVVSDRIWTDASQSEQLQTLRSVLTVRDVTLRDARPDPMCQTTRLQWGQHEALLCMTRPASYGIECARCVWHVLHPYWTAIRTIYSCELPPSCLLLFFLSLLHDVTQYTRWMTPPLRRRCYSNLSDGSIMWPSLNRAKCEQCGQSALKIGYEKESDLNQIWIRFACSLNAA